MTNLDTIPDPAFCIECGVSLPRMPHDDQGDPIYRCDDCMEPGDTAPRDYKDVYR